MGRPRVGFVLLAAATCTSASLTGGCGGAPSAPPTQAKAAAPEKGAPSPAGLPLETATFVVRKQGVVVGQESWERRAGTTREGLRYDVKGHLEARGTALNYQGAVGFDGPRRPGETALQFTMGETVARVSLRREGEGLVLTTKKNDAPPETVKEAKPSVLFVPQPLLAGYAPLCLAAPTEGEHLPAFPGTEVLVLGRRTLQGSTVLTLDVAGLARVDLVCTGDKLAVVRVPLDGYEAVREGSQALAESLAAEGRRVKPALPDTLEEVERTVTVAAAGADAEAKLACSFVAPKASGSPSAPVAPGASEKTKLPALALLTGSGPQDRDEDSPDGGLELSIFKTLAIRLGEAGVATLRCDDRGVGKSSGDFMAATLQTFVRDALAMTETLRAEPRVDGKRVGLLGHSEGAVVAPLAVGKDAKVRALILMAGPARSLADVGMAQMEHHLRQSGLSGPELKAQLDKQKAVLDALRKGSPLPTSLDEDDRRAIERQRAWLKSHLDNDPAAALKKLPVMPVFVAQGERDTQVPKEDAEAMGQIFAKAKNAKAKVKVYPGLNHLFAPTVSGSMADYADPNAQVDEGFLKDVTTFAKDAL